ncbi:MAG: hypothetical protein HWE25_04325 [Alphaproteobacteria bacterium]|nr:hypothetical protein [Alphaproteobacteria bacterium]
MRNPLWKLAVFTAFCSQPTTASILDTSEFTCPLDGEVFEATTAMSGTSWGQRFDLKQLGPIYQPWPKPKCPTSGFVMYRDNFSEAELNALKTFIWSDHYQQLKTKHTPHFLAALTEEKLGTKGWPVVWLYLQATWETDGTDGPQQVSYLEKLKEVLSLYVDGLEAGSDEWLTGKLLLANTQRRLGHFVSAIAEVRDLQPSYEQDEDTYVKDMLARFIEIAEAKDTRPRGITAESDQYLEDSE